MHCIESGFVFRLKVYCLQAHPCIFQPRNFAGWCPLMDNDLPATFHLSACQTWWQQWPGSLFSHISLCHSLHVGLPPRDWPSSIKPDQVAASLVLAVYTSWSWYPGNKATKHCEVRQSAGIEIPGKFSWVLETNELHTVLVPPDFHWSSKTSGPPMKVEKRERERPKTFYWINRTCSFQGGNWTHTKRRFILHKTITDCHIKNRLSTVLHFRSKFTFALNQPFIYPLPPFLSNTNWISFIHSIQLDSACRRLCTESVKTEEERDYWGHFSEPFFPSRFVWTFVSL